MKLPFSHDIGYNKHDGRALKKQKTKYSSDGMDKKKKKLKVFFFSKKKEKIVILKIHLNKCVNVMDEG